MFKRVVLFFVLLLSLLACKKPEASTPIPPVVIDTNYIPGTTTGTDSIIPKTYLALGDSYTIGQSVAVSERFPVQTVAMLNNVGLRFSQPEIIAQTGWTTGNLLATLDNTPPLKIQYDIVTLLIGVNNQYQGRNLEEYKQQFTTLLERATQYAGNIKAHVFVLSIPDYSVTPFVSTNNKERVAREIDSFNLANKIISEQYQVNYIDITGDSRLAANNPALIATDGLHPSGLQYQLWVNRLAPAIRVLFP